MKVDFRWVVVAVLVVVVSGVTNAAYAQVNPRDVPIVTQPQQRFDAGQDVQPIFEGWTSSDDGSYLFHFGYMNRNYREQPSVPIGSDNHFTPGDEDRGQPTYFFPRTQRYQFTTRVPADTGTTPEDGIVWHLTVNGSEQLAYGWLQPEWEIDVNTITSNSRTGFGRPKDMLYENDEPAVTVSASRTTVNVGDAVTLTALITDDALPPELPPRKPRTRLPSLIRPDDLPKAPDNIRWYTKQRPPRNGLSLLWTVYRGPTNATFEPTGFQRSIEEDEAEREVDGSVTAPTSSGTPATNVAGDGWTSATFETTVTFDEPGTYTVRAWACDAMLLVPADLTITVQ